MSIRGLFLTASLIVLSIGSTINVVYAVEKTMDKRPFALSGAPVRAEGRLRACQARESAIKTRMSHLTQLVNNALKNFDKKATKIETFYTTKLVPKGLTVPNYSTLVSNIQTQKTAVQAALTKAQNDVNGFNCTNGDPKAQMKQFRVDMQATKEALRDYRKSVRDLIVAVRSVVGKSK